MLGKAKEELLGHSIWELFPDAVGNQYWRELHQAAADLRPITSEHYYAAWDRWFENRIYPTSDGVTVFTSDITSRKRMDQALAEREKALVAADQRKDEFLATLAHELRNPLAPIRQAAYIARSALATDAQVRWSHEVVERQVDHMSRLLDDLLDVSRISRGTIQLRLEPVRARRGDRHRHRNRAAAHRRAPPCLQRAQRLRCVAARSRCEPALAGVEQPAVERREVHRHGGRIELHANVQADRLVVRVKDNGIGIAPENLESVFGMFMQVKSSIDRSEGGLGIGLALVKGIVELHGGSVQALSAGIGHGSEFVLRLPIGVRSRRRPMSRQTATRVHAPRALKVLIADDNRDAAETLALLLGLDGHDVRTANDGMLALEVGARVPARCRLARHRHAGTERVRARRARFDASPGRGRTRGSSR